MNYKRTSHHHIQLYLHYYRWTTRYPYVIKLNYFFIIIDELQENLTSPYSIIYLHYHRWTTRYPYVTYKTQSYFHHYYRWTTRYPYVTYNKTQSYFHYYTDELQEKQLMEVATKEVLLGLFPVRLNRTEWDSKPLKDFLVILRECFNDIKAKDIQEKRKAIERLLSSNTTPHYHGRHKRAAGGNHKHEFTDENKYFQHHILHELTHAFHLGSMVILTILLIEVGVLKSTLLTRNL